MLSNLHFFRQIRWIWQFEIWVFEFADPNGEVINVQIYSELMWNIGYQVAFFAQVRPGVHWVVVEAGRPLKETYAYFSRKFPISQIATQVHILVSRDF